MGLVQKEGTLLVPQNVLLLLFSKIQGGHLLVLAIASRTSFPNPSHICITTWGELGGAGDTRSTVAIGPLLRIPLSVIL